MRPPSILQRIHSQLPPAVKNGIEIPGLRAGCDASLRPPPSSSPRFLSASSSYSPSSSSSKRPSDRHRREPLNPRSTGIGYLDTWMNANNYNNNNNNGRNNNNALTRRTPPPPSSVVHHNAATNANYEMISLRLTGDDTRGSLLERLDRHTANGDGDQQQRILPVVLDLSEFRNAAEEGALTALVDAVRSHRGCSLAGISNLPPGVDASAAEEEARSLRLPILRGGGDDGSAPRNNSLGGIAAANNNATNLSSAGRMRRKRRGGVAPLLRQRRPGVPSTRNSIDEDDATTTTNSSSGRNFKTTARSTASTLSTKGDEEGASAEVQIVGTGKLAAQRQHATTPPSAKVHKGSVRSGQLISSDLPHQSVVIVGSVNPGGEVWSEGDVYVFGRLRGRVLAGLSDVGGDDGDGDGDGGGCSDAEGEGETRRRRRGVPRSRIFATSFDPELVCVGNVFRTMEGDAKSSRFGLPEGKAGPAMAMVDEVTGELTFEEMEL